MSPYIDDPDFTLHVGDALETLQAMPAESVHCCVTSPPYFGLRDYGTGTWDGGDAECDHAPTRGIQGQSEDSQRADRAFTGPQPQGQECSRCGATRVDQQLGLEPTPDEYVANMVNVFREVRRVLRADGTLWLNIGDSYNNRSVGRKSSHQGGLGFESEDLSKSWAELTAEGRTRLSIENGDMKEKDLVGIPWMLAFALRADGWYLRSDIIWAKPNPMPESVTDRPTKAHEYLFLLTKSPRYFYDADAIREPAEWARWGDQTNGKHEGSESAAGWIGSATKEELQKKRGGGFSRKYAEQQPTHGAMALARPDTGSGRNKRSVWEIATEAYPDAHFATFPQALVEPCIKAGCPEWVCGTCGKARERIVERQPLVLKEPAVPITERRGDAVNDKRTALSGTQLIPASSQTLGWTDCGHNNYQPGTVLDPFLGSGTTAQVARRLGRKCVGIELNPEYAQLAARRLQQLSLFAVETAEA